MPNVYLIAGTHPVMGGPHQSVAFTAAGAERAAAELFGRWYDLEPVTADNWRELLTRWQRELIRTIADGVTGDAVPDDLLADASGCDVTITQLSCAETPRVCVTIQDAAVQGLVGDIALDVMTIDYDVEGIDPISDASFDIPQADGTTAEALRFTRLGCTVDSEWLDAAAAAPLSMDGNLGIDQACERWITHNVGDYRAGYYAQQQGRDHLSLYSALFLDPDGAMTTVDFMLPGDDSLGERADLGRRAIEAVLGGPVSKLHATVRGPVAA